MYKNMEIFPPKKINSNLNNFQMNFYYFYKVNRK